MPKKIIEKLKETKTFNVEFTDDELYHLNSVLGFVQRHIKDTTEGEKLINAMAERINNIVFADIPF